jgi:hypothetical protein
MTVELLSRHMTAPIPARVRDIAILAGFLCRAANAEGPDAASLAPIDPFCPSDPGFSVCTSVDADPGINLPEAEPYPWNTTIEVGHAYALVCEPVIPQPPGCIDLTELARIVPNIELPSDRR